MDSRICHSQYQKAKENYILELMVALRINSLF